jgi:hypothetical protein
MTGHDSRTSTLFSPLPPGEGPGVRLMLSLGQTLKRRGCLGHKSAARVHVRYSTLTPALSRRERENRAGIPSLFCRRLLEGPATL